MPYVSGLPVLFALASAPRKPLPLLTRTRPISAPHTLHADGVVAQSSRARPARSRAPRVAPTRAS
eukprot:4964443-Pleurochrysis_carterae.AAC.1